MLLPFFSFSRTLMFTSGYSHSHQEMEYIKPKCASQ